MMRCASAVDTKAALPTVNKCLHMQESDAALQWTLSDWSIQIRWIKTCRFKVEVNQGRRIVAAKDFFSQLTKICPFTQFFKAVFLPVPCTRLWKVCCSVAWDLGLSQTKVENREEKYGKNFKYLVAECFQILTASEILDIISQFCS